MPFKEPGTVINYITVKGKQVPEYRCETEITLTNTKTGKEYMSDKEADHDVDNPNSSTQRKDIRRDVKVIVPRLVLGSATLKE